MHTHTLSLLFLPTRDKFPHLPDRLVGQSMHLLRIRNLVVQPRLFVGWSIKGRFEDVLHILGHPNHQLKVILVRSVGWC